MMPGMLGNGMFSGGMSSPIGGMLNQINQQQASPSFLPGMSKGLLGVRDAPLQPIRGIHNPVAGGIRASMGEAPMADMTFKQTPHLFDPNAGANAMAMRDRVYHNDQPVNRSYGGLLMGQGMGEGADPYGSWDTGQAIQRMTPVKPSQPQMLIDLLSGAGLGI